MRQKIVQIPAEEGEHLLILQEDSDAHETVQQIGALFVGPPLSDRRRRYALAVVFGFLEEGGDEPFPEAGVKRIALRLEISGKPLPLAVEEFPDEPLGAYGGEGDF